MKEFSRLNVNNFHGRSSEDGDQLWWGLFANSLPLFYLSNKLIVAVDVIGKITWIVNGIDVHGK